MLKVKRVAVVLSGCGFMDGTEIHEAVLTLLALSKRNLEYRCFAPDRLQAQVTNHLTGEAVEEQRNVLVESARIARGAVASLGTLKVEAFDAVIFPGGFGAANNLSDFASKGADCEVESGVAQAIRDFHRAGKPIAALCIAPVLLAKVLGKGDLTIGNDAQVGDALKAMGAAPKPAGHGEVVIDRALKLVTTPCYMLDSEVSQIAQGADNAVAALLELQ